MKLRDLTSVKQLTCNVMQINQTSNNDIIISVPYNMIQKDNVIILQYLFSYFELTVANLLLKNISVCLLTSYYHAILEKACM